MVVNQPDNIFPAKKLTFPIFTHFEDLLMTHNGVSQWHCNQRTLIQKKDTLLAKNKAIFFKSTQWGPVVALKSIKLSQRGHPNRQFPCTNLQSQNNVLFL